MTAKKQTMRAQLEEIRGLLDHMRGDGSGDTPETRFMMQLLYGAVIRFGIIMPEPEGGVVSSLQVPILEIPEEHKLFWQELANNTILVQIKVEAQDSAEEEVAADAEETPEPESAGDASQEAVGRRPSETLESPPAPAEITIGDIGEPVIDPVAELEALEDAEARRSIEEMNK